jgi:hypothetical protein
MSKRSELEALGLAPDQAVEVERWHRDECGMAVTRLLDYLLRGDRKSLRTRLLGVAFGFGLDRLHGYATQATAARAEGVTQQAIADAAKKALRALEG